MVTIRHDLYRVTGMIPQHHIATTVFPTVSYRKSGSGPAVLLLHGFPANGSLWDPIVDALSKDFTVLNPDLPGTGTSQLGNTNVSIADLAAIVPAILDDAGVGKCVLAGHSMGGYVALAALAQFPERVKGISLVHSTAAADDDAKKEKRAKSIALIDNGGREQFIKGMIPGLFAPEFKDTHADIIHHWTVEGLKLPAETLTAFYRAMMERPSRIAELKDSAVPVQFVVGEEDSTIPWDSVADQTASANVSFIERYPGTGHMGMIERPEKLVVDLRTFINYCQ